VNVTSLEQLGVAGVAVGLELVLLERALGELAQAEGAGEVLGVELAAERRDALAGDGRAARAAQRAALLVVVRLAVRLRVVVEEAAARERPPALLRARPHSFATPCTHTTSSTYH